MYCFGSSAFLISSIVIAKILWFCLFANKIKGAAYIIWILRGFNVISLYSLLQLAVVALLYWFKVRGKGNLYCFEFE